MLLWVASGLARHYHFCRASQCAQIARRRPRSCAPPGKFGRGSGCRCRISQVLTMLAHARTGATGAAAICISWSMAAGAMGVLAGSDGARCRRLSRWVVGGPFWRRASRRDLTPPALATNYPKKELSTTLVFIFWALIISARVMIIYGAKQRTMYRLIESVQSSSGCGNMSFVAEGKGSVVPSERARIKMGCAERCGGSLGACV